MDTATISLNQLESHLWESANILRGPVDAADFKSYVFPLLFFKRISDAHDEEYQSAFKESGDDEEYAQFPQNYRFEVPPSPKPLSTPINEASKSRSSWTKASAPRITVEPIFGSCQHPDDY